MARETQGSPASEKRLEQYGVWVKVKPREVLETPARDESFELSDLESSRPTARSSSADDSALTMEEEELLDELETELTPNEPGRGSTVPDEEPLLEENELPEIEETGGAPSAPSLDELSDEELPELEEEAPARRAAGRSRARDAEVEVTLSEGTGQEEHFDDLAALETELASVATATRGTSTGGSAEILARIEEELRSIRSDLTQLRTELSGLRSKAAAEPAAAAGAGKGGSQGGFFDEDEDETIALTGDELDNILNTADITEEAAEAPSADAEAEPELLSEVEEPSESIAQDDILSYETPTLGEEALTPLEEEPAPSRKAAAEEDTLVLTDDSLLPSSGGDEESAAALEELPSELVLDDLGVEIAEEPSSQAAAALGSDIDLEEIPEIETEPAIAPAAAPRETQDELGDETIDLESLDLGEEPTVIDAVPEQVEDLEEVPDAEAVEDAEPAPAAEADAVADEVDLEALAAEAEELEDEVAARSTADLDISELESVSEDETPAISAAEEIEIPFESETPAAEPLDQVLEAEEVDEQTPPALSDGAEPAIPDNLKEEIRTVLKYMDHLLEALPDEKIQEFASSDYFVMYKKLFEDLGLGE